jgi:penicillin-binding protein 2
VAVRIAVLGGIAIALLGILLTRLWFMQVIGSTEYAQAAEGNRLRTVVTEGPRGNILDREGRVIVGTKKAYNLTVRPQDLTGARREAVLGRLARKLGVPVGDLMRSVEQGESTPYESVVLVDNVGKRLRLYVSERLEAFRGMSLQETFTRDHREGRLAAHLLGYTGRIGEEEIAAYRDRGYIGNERVGKTGVELQYERVLRGTPGRRLVEVDAAGEPTGRRPVRESAPRPGNDLMLTIDLDTQAALEQAIRERVALSSSTGAAGVALDPRTGEVLAMASYDTFNPEAFAEGRSAEISRYVTNADGSFPMLNRATEGAYPPGSTFKVVTALAGLGGGYVEPSTYLYSYGEMEIYGQTFTNFGSVTHGLVDLPTALEVSSDSYFYQLGETFYETPAGTRPEQKAATALGFGAPTGVDLPGEASGLVPDPEWKQRAYPAPDFSAEDRAWRPGDDVQLAVGQGDMLATPLQMAHAYATIANDGVATTPTVGRRVIGPGERQLQDLAADRPTKELGAQEDHLDAIRDGLYRAANGPNGTSTSVFGNVPDEFAVAGKTGTAEPGDGGLDHSWYVGYAPFDDPRIVVAVVVERAGTGASAAAPAVCETMAAHFGYDAAASCGSGASAN